MELFEGHDRLYADSSALKREIPAPTNFASPTRTPGLKKGRRRWGLKYTDAIARKICERIMMKESLESICSDPRMPTKKAVIRWLADPRFSDFREMYYYARRVQAEMFIDEIIDIADSAEKDWKPTYNRHGEQNGWKPDNEAIQRSRVRIDTRKWIAVHLVPKIYGDHVEVNHGISGDLAALIKSASNQHTGLPEPIDGKAKDATNAD